MFCVISTSFTSTMADKVNIRAGTEADIEQICQIDTDASSRFASIPALADLADGSHGPLEPAKVQDWLANGGVYVAQNDQGLVGLIAVQKRDGVLYVAELSVNESQQGRGLGGMLLGQVFDQARQMARRDGKDTARVSLTTFPDVPWNGPWYRRRGFREVDPQTLGLWHVEKAQQDDRDLARPGYRRCCMLREESVTCDLKQ